MRVSLSSRKREGLAFCPAVVEHQSYVRDKARRADRRLRPWKAFEDLHPGHIVTAFLSPRLHTEKGQRWGYKAHEQQNDEVPRRLHVLNFADLRAVVATVG